MPESPIVCDVCNLVLRPLVVHEGLSRQFNYGPKYRKLIDCGVDVVCGGSWPIVDQRVSCVNDVGGVANIFFNSATEATVEVLESIETSGAVCLSAGSATPAQ